MWETSREGWEKSIDLETVVVMSSSSKAGLSFYGTILAFIRCTLLKIPQDSF